MRNAQQAWPFQIARAFQLQRQPRRAHRQQIGGEQGFRDQTPPLAIAGFDAAAPVVAERRRRAPPVGIRTSMSGSCLRKSASRGISHFIAKGGPTPRGKTRTLAGAVTCTVTVTVACELGVS